MEIKKSLQLGSLLQIYGNLLTEKQRKIAEEYFYFDISLSEIAVNNGITRQGVNDVVKKVSNLLLEYENKLGILEKNRDVKNKLQQVLNSNNIESNKTLINKIIEGLEV